MSDGQKNNALSPWAGQARKRQGEDELQELRRQAVEVVLGVALVAGTIAMAANLLPALHDPDGGAGARLTWSGAVPLLAAYVLVLVLTLLVRLDYRLRIAGLLVLGYGAAVYSLAAHGPAGGGTLFLLTLPVLALLLLGSRAGVVLSGVSLLVYAVFALLAAAPVLTDGVRSGRLAASPSAGTPWLGHGLWLAVLLSILAGVQVVLARAQNMALARGRLEAEELAGAGEALARRGEALDRKVGFLEATTAITRDLASAHDEQELLERAVRLAVERLGFDGAAIYLLDDRAEGSPAPPDPGALRAYRQGSGTPHRQGSGTPQDRCTGVPVRGRGQLRLATSHGNIHAAAPGVVSQALARKTPAVEASPPSAAPSRWSGVGRTLLAGAKPGTDLAIPLSPGPGGAEWEALTGSAGDQIIGVLLLHSAEQGPLALGEAPAAVDAALEAMAGQVAVTLEHLRLLSETRASLRELEARYRHTTGEAWPAGASPGERNWQPAHHWQAPGAVARGRGGRPVSPDWDPLFAEARATGEPVVHLDPEQGAYLVAVPVKLRDVPIGVAGFYRDAAAGPWLPEQVASVQAVAERVALAAENLRLLDATRRRATHDRLLAEVTARMRQSLDIDAVLQASVREMRQALAIPEVEIWLDVPHLPGTQVLGEVPGPRVSVPADGLGEGEVEG